MICRLLVFFLALSFFCSAPVCEASAMAALKEKSLKKLKEEKLDIKFTLYNGENLHELIPSVEGKITEHPELLKHAKYVFISALYKGEGYSYLKINVISPNNKHLGFSHELRLPPGSNHQQRVYELVDRGPVLMETSIEEATFDYEVMEAFFK